MSRHGGEAEDAAGTSGDDSDSAAAVQPDTCRTLGRRDEVRPRGALSASNRMPRHWHQRAAARHTLVLQVAAFAAFIGLDPSADADLLWIAEDAMLHPLPPGDKHV